MPLTLSRSAPRWALACLLACSGVAQAQPTVLQGVRGLDQHGKTFQARQLAGHPVLLHFVFAGCSTTCPLQVRELAELHQALPPAVRARVRFVSVTVDPLSDTPAALADYAQRLGAARPGWHFLTGTHAGLAPLYDRLQVFDIRATPPRAEDHRSSLYLYAASGQLVQRFRGVPVDRARLLAELSALESR